MRVYISGPYTKGDPCVNTYNAIMAGNRLLDTGHAPYIPHLSHFWHSTTPRPYRDWMRLDFEWVRVCEAVIRLPGESSGADEEVELATQHGIPVFNSVDEFLTSCQQ